MINIKDKIVPVLDKGFVKVVDSMGDESSIVQAARVSYGSGTRTVREDTGLIKYLFDHAHMTPFEMCELKLHIKCPLFIARQWMRHRTFSYNEVSARYSVVKDNECYIPSKFYSQSKTNKQASDEPLPDFVSETCHNVMEACTQASFYTYNSLMAKGVSREIARLVLPVGTYTEFYCKGNLRNWLHFLGLRTGKGAQSEMQQYADAIVEIVKEWLPSVKDILFQERETNA